MTTSIVFFPSGKVLQHDLSARKLQMCGVEAPHRDYARPFLSDKPSH